MTLYAQNQEGMLLEQPNYTNFTTPQSNIDDEVRTFNKSHINHPEIGMLFSNAPCEDCFEVIEKRTEDSKYFVKKGTDGTYVYQQTGLDPMHLKDENGNLHTIISTLAPDANQPHVYSALRQPIPILINAQDQYACIGQGIKKFYFNRNLQLIYTPNGGEEQMVGFANWNNHTAGDNGVYVTDVFPGIDLEMRVFRGQMKTNFIIKNPMPQFSYGELRIRDRLNMSDGLHIFHDGEKRFFGSLEVQDELSSTVCIIDPAVIYDNEPKKNGKFDLAYELNGLQLDIIIPTEWVNKNATSYPVTIDPLVSGTNNMAITGSGYNATCFVGGCTYNLSVPVPAAITVTDVRFSFSYVATNPCWLNDGAMDFLLGACKSPAPAGFFWFCNLASPGNCNGNNLSMFTDVAACIPAPTCPSYNLNFTMRFYRCYSAGGGCSNTCIGASTPWTMVVEGRTVQTTGNVTSLPAVTICQGQSTTLSATGQYGVAPYNYTWNPGGLTGSPSVSPATTTIYTVTITDACGQTATATKTVNVTLNNNPGFTVNPNPACVGQNVTISGNGSGAVSLYDWLIPGSANPIANNIQVVNTSYATAGTYPITLNYTNGACVFPVVQNITIDPLSAPTVNIVAAPAGPICSGTNVTFTANITNGGTSPTYQWQINGVNAGTNSSTFSTSTLTNGDVVTVILTSNSPCASPTTAVSNSIVITVNPPVIPTINIVAAPSGPVCAGTNVTFTANITNGGSGPSYQWQVNGMNVGTNTNTYSTTALNNGDVVTCILTSNDPCASPIIANSNTIAVVVNPIVSPTIIIAAAPSGPYCAGANITFTANITNGGSAPAYQWQVNGLNVGTNSNTFSTSVLNNGDVVSCTLTSNDPCANPLTATSNTIAVTIIPNVLPTINIIAVPSGPICSGTNVTFTANITNGGITPTYQWAVNGNPVGINSNSYAFSAFNNGDVVTCTLVSNEPCASPAVVISNNIIMTVNPVVTPTINISSVPTMPYCAGTNVTFTANITNGGTTPTYQWQINGVNAGTNSNSFSSTTLLPGDMVTCILTSNELCVTNAVANSNTIIISHFPPVTLTASGDTSICEDELLTLYAFPTNGNPANYDVVWQPYNYTGTSITETPNTSIVYTVTVTDACGSSASETISVTVNPQPTAAFTFSPNPPDLTAQPTLFTDASINAVTWDWSFGNGSSSTAQNPSFEYEQEGTYPVILIIGSQDGCTDTAMSILIFEGVYSLFIPSAFSPNLDEINPIFYGYGNGIETFRMEIFDRWGNRLFTSDDLEHGWDGRLQNGQLAPQGVYNYKIDVVFYSHKTESVLGKVTLLR